MEYGVLNMLNHVLEQTDNYVISVLLANFSLAEYIASLKQREDFDVQHVNKIFKIALIIFYTIFLVTFIISTIINI
jgi:hypothetical protein